MASEIKGQARDCAFLTSGKLCFTLPKQFSICFIFIWNKLWNAIANLEQLPMPSKLCRFQNRLVYAGCAVPRTLLDSWELFFVSFGIQLLMRDVHPPKELPSLDFSKVLELAYHVLTECGNTSCSQVLGAVQWVCYFFLDRWQCVFVLHPFSCQTPTVVKHFWISLTADHFLIEWGLTSYNQSGLLWATRWLFSRAFLDASLHSKKKIWQLSS